MIGVIASPAEHDVVREFFELFKTPWEFHRGTRHYEVALCAGGEDPARANADLVLVFAADRLPFDAALGLTSTSERGPSLLSYRGRPLPIYGMRLTFDRSHGVDLRDARAGRSAGTVVRSGRRVVVRIGYNLFREIRAVLGAGQPTANASIPSVEMHIALVRDLIVRWAAPLVEIPPSPAGHPIIACLTHDVDHPSIRRHRWDHTALGFVYRATVGSLVNVARGRLPLRGLIENLVAVITLPFVHLGLARDFWDEFPRYLRLEQGLASTFFVIPFEGVPGDTADGPAPAHRASRYGARDIAHRIAALAAQGCEIGVHGLDAWRDSAKGRQELEEIARLTGASDPGVRMHWLYASDQSPAMLEKAGFAYDSTMGYNGAVGFRAGTTQVFKPFDAVRLLELPLHVMDTALFYPARMHLSPRDARARVSELLDDTARFGGVFTVNWHDRSIAPERLWGDFYVALLDDLRARNAWFATAGRAVAWFRKRRSAQFEAVSTDAGVVRVNVSCDGGDELPALRLRVHRRDGTVDVPIAPKREILVAA